MSQESTSTQSSLESLYQVFSHQQSTSQQSTSQQSTSQQSTSQQSISQQSIFQQSISQQSTPQLSTFQQSTPQQFTFQQSTPQSTSQSTSQQSIQSSSQQFSFQQSSILSSIPQTFPQLTHQDSQQSIINMFEDFVFDNTIIEEFNNSADLPIVYKFYTFIKDTKRFKCKLCSTDYAKPKNKSTGTMRSHLKNKHQIDLNELENKTTGKKKFTQAEFINIITDWIVDDDQSFRVVEKPSFKRIIEYLNNEAKLVSGTTIKNKIISKYESEQIEIINKLQILAITTDNASNNNTMFRYFANHCIYNQINFDMNNQRVRCLAHIINLAAQDLLKNLKAEGLNENKILLNNEDISSTVKK
ncbi:13745_t:CDS:2, partial [Dentiscutata erythropus]